MYVYVYSFPGLSQDIGYSSLYYMVGPYCLSIQYLIVFCTLVFYLIWLHCAVCRVSVPWPEIDPGLWQWKARILITRPLGSSLYTFILSKLCILEVLDLQRNCHCVCSAIITCQGINNSSQPMSQWGCPLVGSGAFPLLVKNSPTSAGDMRVEGLIPGLRRSPGGGHSIPRQYSCLENPMDRGARRTTVHGVTKSQTRLSC